MPARTGCCKFNLAKLDPTTGAIIWTKLIRGIGPWTTPAIWCVEALHGTNDIVVLVGDVTQNNADLCRVDANGNQVWSFTTKYFPNKIMRGIRHISCASGTIVVNTTNSSAGTQGPIGLDYNGNIIWNLYPYTNMSSLAFGSAQGVWVFAFDVINFPQHRWNLFDISTASAIFHTNDQNPFTGPFLRCIQPQTGYLLANFQTSGHPEGPFGWIEPPSVIATGGGAFAFTDDWVLGNGTTGLADIGGSIGAISRLNNPNGCVATNPSFDKFYSVPIAGEINPAIYPNIWTATTAFGASLSPVDCDADLTGCYFASGPLGSGNINAYKRNLNYGAVLWGQDIKFSLNKSLSCGVADSGYFYVGGSPA